MNFWTSNAEYMFLNVYYSHFFKKTKLTNRRVMSIWYSRIQVIVLLPSTLNGNFFILKETKQQYDYLRVDR